MNNEPVAWMNSLVKWDIAVEQDITHDIPLYTHPEKTLTDEEIMEIHEKLFADTEIIHFLDFARAILRKAQEK